MRLRIASDLHIDHRRDLGRYLFERLDQGTFDVLIVAGDIANALAAPQALRSMAERVHRPIVYVPGNHDFYGTTFADGLQALRDVSLEHPHLHVLDNDVLVIDGQRFVGATLWFEHPGVPLSTDQLLGDFWYIENIWSWVGQHAVRSAAFLEHQAGPGDVVVTHHLPHPRSVATKFAASALNRYFLHDLRHLVERGRMKLWVHGHTHEPCNYRLNADTRVVCNPIGYASENRPFRALDIDV